MVSARCKMVVKDELKKLGLHFIVVDLGEVEIMENITDEQREQLPSAEVLQQLLLDFSELGDPLFELGRIRSFDPERVL